MKRAFALPLALLLASGCQPPENAQVDKAWVRLSAVQANPSAAYFTLTGGAKDATLTGVWTPSATRTEMHESMNAGGMMSMAPIKAVAVRAGSTVAFAPGGKHVMLYGLTGAKPGGTIPIKFSFADGQSTIVDAKVVAAGDSAPGE